MVESVFRRFKDFDPYKGTPIDMMHNLESGIMKDLLEVYHLHIQKTLSHEVYGRFWRSTCLLGR
jgi:hypothetical protein